MGARGPAAKPSVLKQAQGTYRKDRVAGTEPKPLPGDPGCPTWLHREAKREWRRIAPELLRLNLLTIADRAVLAAYCQAYARWYDAEKLVKSEGMIARSLQGAVYQHPAVGIANKAMHEMRVLASEFGMSPAARTRIDAKPPAEGGKDDAKSFLFGVRGGKAG